MATYFILEERFGGLRPAFDPGAVAPRTGLGLIVFGAVSFSMGFVSFSAMSASFFLRGTRGDRFAVRTYGGVSLRRADLLDGEVAQRKVDLRRGPAGGLGREAGPGEEALGDPVVAPVFFEAGEPTVGETALSAEAGDQPELLEGAQVGQGRRRSDAKSR
ncbi:MAG TPA: hypothetical protein VMH90_02165, partial [Thermoplasmata archaeon]|nr:hypothetical protein [Thermoplasmata archaeon]